MSELEGLDGTVNVYVNGKEVEVFMGARVRDALMTYDQEAFSEHLQGEIRIEDQDGTPTESTNVWQTVHNTLLMKIMLFKSFNSQNCCCGFFYIHELCQ